MGGWIIVAIIAAVVVFEFLLFFCVAACSSARDAFDHEADDQEQIAYLREYNRRKAARKKSKARRWHVN